MAGNTCDKCKLTFESRDKLFFDGWYLLCTQCLDEVCPNQANLIRLHQQMKLQQITPG
jgi:hypothetical protein